MAIFKRKQKQVQLAPALTKTEDPVNFDTVLDYTIGLSEEDYDKLFKVSKIYRDANVAAATVLGFEDKPTTAIEDPKASDAAIDTALDDALQGVDFIEQSPDKSETRQIVVENR